MNGARRRFSTPHSIGRDESARVRAARRSNRRGAITMFVLVCLVIIATLSAVLLRSNLTERTALKTEERKLQSEWLVESGLERASARLAAKSNYTGETWELSPDDFGGSYGARVAITVEAVENKPRSRRLHVRADYPSDEAMRTRLSKEVIIDGVAASGGETR